MKPAIIELDNILLKTDIDSCEQRKNILQSLIISNKYSSSEIKKLHQLLQFLLAYPHDPEEYRLANTKLDELSSTVKTLPVNKLDQLIRTGIPYTEFQGSFSFTIINWLVKDYKNQIAFHSFDEDGVHSKEILKPLFNEMEFELLSNEGLSSEAWIKQASGQTNDYDLLEWFISLFDQLEVPLQTKEYLFDSIKLYIRIVPNSNYFSKSYGRLNIDKIYYHKQGLLKKFEINQIINKPLPKAKPLDKKRKEEIRNLSRIALILLNRETDPITYNNPEDIIFYELEHGLSIALFSILPEQRLPLESYIGFMMFKNGYPMSYGGAWLLGKRSLIGVNIFESFRGGESAFVFAQLLRTYRMAFAADYFEVEPYQFGKNNPEGIKSGAFWFYHRFGFRPLDADLNKLAEKEFQKIRSKPGYRSTFDVLKKFTKSNLYVDFGDTKEIPLPFAISNLITEKITIDFKGSRKKAEAFVLKQLKSKLNLNTHTWTREEKKGLDKLILFVGFCLDLNHLGKSELKKLENLIKLKGSNEFEYILAFNKLRLTKFCNKDLISFLD